MGMKWVSKLIPSSIGPSHSPKTVLGMRTVKEPLVRYGRQANGSLDHRGLCNTCCTSAWIEKRPVK